MIAARYLGTQGVWGIGMDSFACVTARRISSLRVGPFGEVVYQDADVRDVNSGALHQPSRLQLYLFVGVLSIMTCGIGLLLLPLTVRLFYRFKKSGLIVWVKESYTLHVFSDRKLVGTTNELYRLALTVPSRPARHREQSPGIPPLLVITHKRSRVVAAGKAGTDTAPATSRSPGAAR